MSTRPLPKGIRRKTLPNGETRYVVRRVVRIHGRRRELTRVAMTLSEAKTYRRDLDQKARDLKYGTTPPDRPDSLEHVLQDFEKSMLVEAKYDEEGFKLKGYRKSEQYGVMLKAIREFFPAGTRLEDVTGHDIERFAQFVKERPVVMRYRRKVMDEDGREQWEMVEKKRSKSRSSATVRRYLAMLSKVFTYAVRRGWIAKQDHPFITAELPQAFSVEVEKGRKPRDGKRKTRHWKTLSLEDEGRLLAACTGDRRHLRPILIALIDTGRRVGEILSLKWRNVDLTNRTLYIERSTTKTRKDDVVQYSNRLAQALEEIRPANLKMHSEENVFTYTPRASNKPRPVKSIKRAFSSACKAAGISGLRIHDIRHTHGSRLHEAGVPLKTIQERLGHTRLETTENYYLHTTDEGAAKALSVIDQLGAKVASDDGATTEEVN